MSKRSLRFLVGDWTRRMPAALLGLTMATAVRAQTAGISPPRIGGYLQVREVAQEDAGLSASLNRARVSLDGALPSSFSYRFLLEMEAVTGARTPAAVSLREAMVRWSQGALVLTGGQFKTPFSREYLLPVPVLETADFASVVDSLAPKYDVGLMAEVAFGPVAGVSLGVFNGEGANSTVNRDSTALLVGRVVTRPVAGLALGGSITRDAADSLRWGIEGVVEQWGGMVRAEYITRHRRGRAQVDDDFGWYLLGTFRVVPRLTLVGRLEDFQRPSIGTSRRTRAATAGVNWEFVPDRVRLLVNAVRRASGAHQLRTQTLIGQLQVRF
jgi:hypothetical protein